MVLAQELGITGLKSPYNFWFDELLIKSNEFKKKKDFCFEKKEVLDETYQSVIVWFKSSFGHPNLIKFSPLLILGLTGLGFGPNHDWV